MLNYLSFAQLLEVLIMYRDPPKRIRQIILDNLICRNMSYNYVIMKYNMYVIILSCYYLNRI